MKTVYDVTYHKSNNKIMLEPHRIEDNEQNGRIGIVKEGHTYKNTWVETDDPEVALHKAKELFDAPLAIDVTSEIVSLLCSMWAKEMLTEDEKEEVLYRLYRLHDKVRGIDV